MIKNRNVSVSIGIPTIGDNNFISQALHSALSQMPIEGEIIISCNASKNFEYLLNLEKSDPSGRIKVIHQENRISMAENWNRCLYAAQGKYFLLLSDDDMISPGFLYKTMAILEKDSTIAIASCRVDWINENGRRFFRTPILPEQESCLRVLLGVFKRKRVILPCATLFRKNDLISVGGYDSNYGNWADMKAWIEVASRYQNIGFVNESLAMYRERPASLTKIINDIEWRDCIEKTIELACDIYPWDSGKIRTAGTSYLEYLIADIKMKRYLTETNFYFAQYNVWKSTKNLSFNNRLWLLAKFSYLRLQNA